MNRLAESGGALDGALALARDIAAFPQGCLRNDRTSMLDQRGRPLGDALHREMELGMATLRSGETQSGAARFAAGAGRHGSFDEH